MNMRSLGKVACAAFLTIGGGQAFADEGTVQAGVYYVDPVNGDDVNNTGLVTVYGDGSAVTSALKTVTKAAKKLKAWQTVVMLPGTHDIACTVTNNIRGVTFRGASTNAADVILDAHDERRIFCITGINATSNRFENLTFANGYRPAFGTPAAAAYGDTLGGGAVVVDFVTAQTVGHVLIFTNCVFQNNRSDYILYQSGKPKESGGGGAIHSLWAVEMADCVFSNNVANGVNLGGGAVFVNCDGATAASSFERCSFGFNAATNSGCGGALCFYKKSAGCTLRDCTFTSNKCVRGSSSATGALRLGGGAYGHFSRLENCDFIGNRTVAHSQELPKDADGGGLYLMRLKGDTEEQSVSLVNCTFHGNHADGQMGAFGYCGLSSCTYVVSNCVFESNTAFVSAPAMGSVEFAVNKSFKLLDSVFCNNRITGLLGTMTDNLTDLFDVICPVAHVRASELFVARCRFKDNFSDGLCSGLAVCNRKGDRIDGTLIENCIFEGNVCGCPTNSATTADNPSGPLWFATPVVDVVVRNCLFVTNRTERYNCGTIAFQWPATTFARDNYEIIENCTFVGNRANAKGKDSAPLGGPFMVKYTQTTSPTNFWIRNCIYADNGSTAETPAVRDIMTDTKPALSNCLFKVAGGNSKYTVTDGYSGCKVGYDPNFADATKGDYRLAKGSPAIDAGVDQPWMLGTGVYDLSVIERTGKKRARHVGASVDIGCYEWAAVPGFMLILR